MNTFKIIVVASTAVAAFASIPFASAASAGMTGDQHAAVAQELQAKADAASAKAARHEVMARTGSPKGNRQAMASHCERLVGQYRAEADEYASAAADHKRLATAN